MISSLVTADTNLSLSVLPVAATQIDMADRQNFSKEVFEVFRRVTDDTWATISPQIQAASLSETHLNAFIAYDYQSPIFAAEDWQFSLIKAYIQGRLSLKTYVHLTLFKACQDKQGLVVHKGAQIYTACPDLKQIKVSEDDQVFTFDIPSDWKLLRALLAYPGFVPVGVAAGETQIVIIPPHLLKPFYERKYAATGLDANLVHGYSKPEDFANLKKRDVMLPSSLFPFPEELHNNGSLDPLTVYFHDAVFHWPIDLCVVHRKLWIELAAAVKGGNESHMSAQESKVWEAMLDRLFINYMYRRELMTELNDLFWLALRSLIIQVEENQFAVSCLDRIKKFLDTPSDIVEFENIRLPSSSFLQRVDDVNHVVIRRFDFAYLRMGGDIKQLPEDRQSALQNFLNTLGPITPETCF